VQIEGLQQSGAPPKRPIYGKSKKGGPAKGDSVPQTPEPPQSKELASEPTPELESGQSPATEDVQDDWEASSSEEETAPPPAETKESWDDSSDEEEAEVSVETSAQNPAPAPQAVKKPVPTKGVPAAV
jgi:translation initiation factor 5B